MSLLVVTLACLWMLLLPSVDDLVILNGGLWPPVLLMDLLVGALSCL